METTGTSGNPAGSPRGLFVVLRTWAVAGACAVLFAGAGAAPSSAPSLSFRRLTIEQGLPATDVLRVLEDSRGFMWFSTNDGLVRYDGREIRVFRPEVGNPHSLSDRKVTDLKEDAQGDLWVATENGLDCWDRATERFAHFRYDPAKSVRRTPNFIRCLLLDPEGCIWVGTNAGVSRFYPKTGQWERFLVEHTALSLLRDKNGMLWVGTGSQGLQRLDPRTGVTQRMAHDSNDPEGLKTARVTSLAEDAEGGLWVATGSGLFHLDAERRPLEQFGYDPNDPGALQAGIVEVVLIDRSGVVWAGTDGGGLSRFDPSTRRFVHYRHSRYAANTLSSDVVRTLCEDRHGDLWVGHYPAGVSHANQLAAPFQVIRSLPGNANTLSDDHVQAFWEDPSGDLWVGTDKGGLNHWEAATGRWKAYQHDPRNPRSLSAKAVLSVLRDRRGDLWAGTWNGGLNRLEPDTGTFRHYLPDAARANALSSRHVWRLFEDRQGSVWVVPGWGLERYSPEDDGFEHHINALRDPGGLAYNFASALMEDRAGSLWVGTSRGLIRRDPTTGAWQQWPDTTGPLGVLSNHVIIDLLEDQDGAIWACAQGAGLWRLDTRTGQAEGLRMTDGLPSDVLRSILADDDGILWVASNNGLARVDPRTRQIRTFDEHSGLPSRYFSSGARLRLRSGELVFGTTQGFVKFQPRAIQSNKDPPPVVFTDLEVFNQRMAPGAPGSPLQQSLAETRRLEIPARLSMLTFHFAVLNHRSPQRNRSLYQLEGFDREWRDPGTDFRAIYTNLDPGRYTLRVKAANNDGVWNETGASLELIIVPPWWWTWWFRGAAVVLVLGGAVAIGSRISTRRTRARLLEMERESRLAHEREQAQTEREKLQEQLTQAQKMESVGRLAGGVAHDFNNMLQAILGNAALTLQDLPPDSPVREGLEEIEKSARRSAELTRQLLAFARKQTIAPKVLDLNDTVAGMLKMLRRLIGEDIELVWMPGANLWPVKMDTSQIDQILANLCVNARDAIGGVGTVKIETTNATLDDTYVATHPEAAAGDYVVLAVSDTGRGMDAETRSHLFEPFFTTKEQGKGTGLGLATVFGIVKQNQGLISVYTEPGRGSTFKIFLPRSEAEAPAAVSSAPTHGMRGTETVMLVEDEVQILNLGRRILEQHGYTVLAASTPEAALALAAQTSAPIHLLITDVVMPGMNGKELAARLQAGRPALRCIFMSGYTASVIAHHGVLEDGVAFLQKPFTIQNLTAKVREVLEA